MFVFRLPYVAELPIFCLHINSIIRFVLTIFIFRKCTENGANQLLPPSVFTHESKGLGISQHFNVMVSHEMLE